MTDLHHAIAVAALADADEFEYAYRSAVAEGAEDTRSSAARERDLGALRLLTLASLRLPDLALQTCLLDIVEPHAADAIDVALESACQTSAGALRLAHRALEAHSQALGYAPLAWTAHAHERARNTLAESQAALLEGGSGAMYTHVRRIAVALARASAATADDDLRVPDETATALGHLLALYMIATEAIGTSPPPPA